MKMELKKDDSIIILDESEQSMVYEFYRLHCTIERMQDILDEEEMNIHFKNDEDAKVVARRVLELIDNYHVGEDEAIHTVMDDTEYISHYTTTN